MWTDIEASLDKNEQSKPSPLRRAIFRLIRSSDLRPGHGTQYMVSFEFGEGDRLLWEIAAARELLPPHQVQVPC